VSQTIDHTSRDELGQLAEAFRSIVTMLKDHAQAAEKVAAGDLNVSVSAASDQDVLGKALAKVLTNLKRLMDEMTKMTREHDLGDIDVMIPATEFEVFESRAGNQRYGGRPYHCEEESNGLHRRVCAGELRSSAGEIPR
jgi:HAMP domain-containing protein